MDWPSFQAGLHITCEGDRIIVCVGRLTCNGHTKPIVHMLLCHHQNHEDACMPRSTVRKRTLPSCMACTSARSGRSHTPLTPAVQHHHQQRRLLGGRPYCAVRLQRPLAISTIRHLLIRRRSRHHDDAALVTESDSGSGEDGLVHHQKVQRVALIEYVSGDPLQDVSFKASVSHLHCNCRTVTCFPKVNCCASGCSCVPVAQFTDPSLRAPGQKPTRGLCLATFPIS